MKYLLFFSIITLFPSCCTVTGFFIGAAATEEVESESIQTGTDVYLTLLNGNEVDGIYNGIRDSMLYLTIDEKEWEIAISDIERIEVADKKWRYIGLLAGAGVDVLLLLIIGMSAGYGGVGSHATF